MSKTLIISIVLACVSLTACTPGELVKTTSVDVKVTDVKNTYRRFWAVFTDTDGNTYNTRIGGKRCRGGPENLKLGTKLSIIVNTYRNDDSELILQVDRSDLRSRFC